MTERMTPPPDAQALELRKGNDSFWPPPIKQPPRRATGAAQVANGRQSGFNVPGVGRDGAKRKRRAALLDGIEQRARERDRQARFALGMPAGRVHDLTVLFADTYGDVLPNNERGRDALFILAHHVARLRGDAELNIRRYAGAWAPWLADGRLAAFVGRVLARPYKWRALTLGVKLGLRDSVRERLGITTIAAMDVLKAQRERQRRERQRRERWNAKRRKQTRKQYLAGSLSKAAPWKAERKSRATWYRQQTRQSCRETSETGPRHAYKVSDMLTHTCLTAAPLHVAQPQAAMPALVVSLGCALSPPTEPALSQTVVGLGRENASGRSTKGIAL